MQRFNVLLTLLTLFKKDKEHMRKERRWLGVARAALAPHVVTCGCYVRRCEPCRMSAVRAAAKCRALTSTKCNAADLHHVVEQLLGCRMHGGGG